MAETGSDKIWDIPFGKFKPRLSLLPHSCPVGSARRQRSAVGVLIFFNFKASEAKTGPKNKQMAFIAQPCLTTRRGSWKMGSEVGNITNYFSVRCFRCNCNPPFFLIVTVRLIDWITLKLKVLKQLCPLCTTTNSYPRPSLKSSSWPWLNGFQGDSWQGDVCGSKTKNFRCERIFAEYENKGIPGTDLERIHTWY